MQNEARHQRTRQTNYVLVLFRELSLLACFCDAPLPRSETIMRTPTPAIHPSPPATPPAGAHRPLAAPAPPLLHVIVLPCNTKPRRERFITEQATLVPSQGARSDALSACCPLDDCALTAVEEEHVPRLHLFCISVLQTRAVTRPGTYCERRGFHSDFEFFDHLFDTRTWTMPTAIPCLSAPHAHRPRQTHNRSPHLVTGTRTRLSEVR